MAQCHSIKQTVGTIQIALFFKYKTCIHVEYSYSSRKSQMLCHMVDLYQFPQEDARVSNVKCSLVLTTYGRYSKEEDSDSGGWITPPPLYRCQNKRLACTECYTYRSTPIHLTSTAFRYKNSICYIMSLDTHLHVPHSDVHWFYN